MSNTIYMKQVTFTVAAHDYATQLSSVALTPNTTTATWAGFNGATQKNTAAADWSADLTFGQDWSADGFSRYLYENEGEEVEVVFAPKSGGPTFTATVTLTPGSVGGATNTYVESTVSLPVNGKPELSTAA
ncbi:hypothetical protein DEJ17_09745 [Curtobacterium sp. MCSS17_011]|uniref:hypothetical protein n=1 Tax=Curtobacterium sp. MCSS17_011 TaxID=2175643 RepID=UPI000D96B2A4|nr:hypothetical protein [Curtobacterium sp. MCSS17_011]PYY57773.1 hypothetical protein DEJ17_09745 [Curtobacterium sp. MCSS17_011]